MTLLARPPSQPRLLTVVKQDGIVTEKMYRVASSAKLTHLAHILAFRRAFKFPVLPLSLLALALPLLLRVWATVYAAGRR